MWKIHVECGKKKRTNLSWTFDKNTLCLSLCGLIFFFFFFGMKNSFSSSWVCVQNVWNFDQWWFIWIIFHPNVRLFVCVFWLQNRHEVFIWSNNDVETIIRNKIRYKNRLIGCEWLMARIQELDPQKMLFTAHT